MWAAYFAVSVEPVGSQNFFIHNAHLCLSTKEKTTILKTLNINILDQNSIREHNEQDALCAY